MWGRKEEGFIKRDSAHGGPARQLLWKVVKEEELVPKEVCDTLKSFRSWVGSENLVTCN